MGTEDDPREEEQQEVLSFHHLLIMEFCAGKYISTLQEVSPLYALPCMLSNPVWECINLKQKIQTQKQTYPQRSKMSVHFTLLLNFWFQSDLLKLFPIFDSVEQHMEVLKFAAGLSEKVKCFLCQHHFPAIKSHQLRLFADLFEQNELFSQELLEMVPPVFELQLDNMHLKAAEIQSLCQAMEAEKLPQLQELDLGYNDLSHMEREVKALIAACDAHCEKRLQLRLWVTALSDEFIQRCKNKYENVEIWG